MEGGGPDPLDLRKSCSTTYTYFIFWVLTLLLEGWALLRCSHSLRHRVIQISAAKSKRRYHQPTLPYCQQPQQLFSIAFL